VQRIDGQPVKTVADLRRLTENSDGKPVKITFVRNAQEVSLSMERQN
jgi:S1-C subfamily serine protease